MNNGPEQRKHEREEELDPELAQMEAALTGALRRVDPPEGFAHGVFARAILDESRATQNAPAAKGKLLSFPRWNYAIGGALAASLLVGAFVAESVHQRHERERAEAAERQLTTAMRVTGHALDQTRAQLAKAGIRIME